jgi:protein ImuB
MVGKCGMEIGQARMKEELYACVHVSEFPAQALLRLRPDLKGRPVVVLHGETTQESVCSFNQLAQRRGATLGMTKLDAEGVTGLVLLSRSKQGEAAARTVLFECAATFSPRIEEVSQDTSCAFVLDIAGSERLFGPPIQLAERLRISLANVGFHASITVSRNFDAARLKAGAARGIVVIPHGDETAELANLSIAELPLDEHHLETFAIWGIRTLGALATLPETELVTRLGQEASEWRNLAKGTAAHTFQPIEPTLSLQEFCEFETPVERMDSLLFIGARMIDCLAARAAGHALSLASLAVEMKLEGGRVHRGTIRPALPSIDRKFLLKLLQLEIAAHPPPASVVALTLTAEAGLSSKVQLGLFAPQTPEPSRLDITLARLKAIVGDDRVGSPELDDTHRPGSFHMKDFAVEGKATASKASHVRMGLRRMRPPESVRVSLRDAKPDFFRSRENSFEVVAAYGPWKSAGCWWSADGWDLEEWDVLAVHQNGLSVACLLVYDRARNEWRIEAHYD